MTDEPNTPHPDDPDAPSEDETELLAELGAALGDDPVPDGLATRAAALGTWFRVDDELIALLSEHAEEPAGVRGGGVAAEVFATPDGELEVEIEIGDGRVSGTLTIGDHDSVRLVDRAGVTGPAHPVDALGRFEIVVADRGPHRLRFDGLDTPSAVTEWLML